MMSERMAEKSKFIMFFKSLVQVSVSAPHIMNEGSINIAL